MRVDNRYQFKLIIKYYEKQVHNFISGLQIKIPGFKACSGEGIWHIVKIILSQHSS